MTRTVSFNQTEVGSLRDEVRDSAAVPPKQKYEVRDELQEQLLDSSNSGGSNKII